MSRKVFGIVGSYRKDGIIDRLVTETLAAARDHGAEISKIYLYDKHIEFCTNCRTCTQAAGPFRGQCIHDDEMESMLAQYEASDALVLGAPVNFFNVNAVTRRFIERLVCFAHWPWGTNAPRVRSKAATKQAVLITSSAMPAMMGRVFTGAPRALRTAARTMGAKPVALIYAGMIAKEKEADPPPRCLRQARKAGRRIACG